MAIVGWVLIGLLTLYEWILIVRAVFSWIQLLRPRWVPRGILLVIAEAVYTVTDPPLRLVGKLIKPLRVGSVRLDLAFLVLFILVVLCIALIQWVVW